MGKAGKRVVKRRNAAAKALPRFKHKVYRDRTKYNRKSNKRENYENT